MIPHLAGLSRAERRNALLHLERENGKWPDRLVRMSDEEMAERSSRAPADFTRPVQVWRSKTLLVQVFDETGDGSAQLLRLSIARTSVDPLTMRWKDGLTWEELQAAKAAVGYGDREAVEIFPPDYAVVNVANMRHLWVLAGRMAFSWGPRWKPAHCPRCARVQETIDDGTTCKVCHLVLP